MSCDATRRQFLGMTASCVAGVVLGFLWHPAKASGSGNLPPLDGWIQIESDGRVVLWVAKAEMGQGVLTALAMLLAEELEVDWGQVEVRQAPVDPTRYD